MEKEKRTLKFSEIFGFGAGGMFTYGFQLMITGYYLLYYMTDIAGFSTVLAASLYSTIQIIKMVTMLFSGVRQVQNMGAGIRHRSGSVLPPQLFLLSPAAVGLRCGVHDHLHSADAVL